MRRLRRRFPVGASAHREAASGRSSLGRLTYRLERGIGRSFVAHPNQGRSDMQKQHIFLSQKLIAPIVPTQSSITERAI